MANREHVEILSQGVEAWNAWRQKNPEVRPDVRGATLRKKHLNALAAYVNESFRSDSGEEPESPEIREALSRMDRWQRESFLEGMDLRSADLSGMDLGATNLKGTDLRGANLSGSDLREALVLGARLNQANLNDADLRDARRLTQAQLDSANGNSATRLSPGLRRPRHWLEATRGRELLSAGDCPDQHGKGPVDGPLRRYVMASRKVNSNQSTAVRRLALGMSLALAGSEQSAKEVAGRCGVTTAHLSKIMSGLKKNPSQEVLEVFAREVGHTIGQIYDLGDQALEREAARARRKALERALAEPTVTALVDAAKQLDEASRDEVIRQLQGLG